MNILDETTNTEQPNFNNETSDLERKIQKLRDEDAAQKTRTWAWYQRLRKENPDLYRNAKTHAQMVADYQALGEKFEDGGFND